MKTSSPLILMCIALLCSCGGKPDTEQEDAMPELYDKVLRLTKLYADSMSLARDSATVNTLMHRYEDKMERINMDVPRGTDMNMTPDRNDSLYAMTQRLLKARDKALAAPADTVASDTIVDGKPLHNDTKKS